MITIQITTNEATPAITAAITATETSSSDEPISKGMIMEKFNLQWVNVRDNLTKNDYVYKFYHTTR